MLIMEIILCNVYLIRERHGVYAVRREYEPGSIPVEVRGDQAGKLHRMLVLANTIYAYPDARFSSGFRFKTNTI